MNKISDIREPAASQPERRKEGPKSLLLPNKHFEGEAQIFHLPVLANDRFKALVQIFALRIVLFVDHQNAQHLLVHFVAHLVCNVLLLLLNPLLHGLDHERL